MAAREGADSRTPRPSANARARWSRLSGQEKAAAIEALVVVASVRALLTMAPDALTASALRRLMSSARDVCRVDTPAAELSIGQTITAIRRASLRVPNATCLVQAISGWIMLRRRGVSAVLRIGVQTNPRAFAAHAWLCVGGRVVIGGYDAETRFVTLDEHRGH